MNALGLIEQQLRRMKSRPVFVVAPDQSGGSAPKPLATYALLDGAVQSILGTSNVKPDPRKRTTSKVEGVEAGA